jgi:hypothetical protein
MSTSSIAWTDRNLASHHAKRLRENAGCFEDLLAITGRSITLEEYRDLSEVVVVNSWCEYEAQSWDPVLRTYRKRNASYIDNDLVVAIVDLSRLFFMTCVHEHFDSRRPLHGKNPGRTVSVAQRRFRYLDDLRIKEKGRLIINLRIIRGGQPQK